jgi:hypothetical protein
MEIDIKMILKEMGWEGLNCVNLGRDRDKWQAVLITEKNFRLLCNAERFFWPVG